METWITDECGNRASVEHWGSAEKARESLATLRDCIDCTDCSDCSDCTDCIDCSNCSNCSNCTYCRECRDCSKCSGCRRCSNCSNCSGCEDCSGCLGCTYCWDCSGCLGCTYCWDSEEKEGSTEIPVVENIHQKVYEFASQPGNMDSSNWHHSCGTTHRRAGAVVHLAGEAGRELEKQADCVFAAMQIYRASDPENPVPPERFHDTNEEALADMKRLAELEAKKPTA